MTLMEPYSERNNPVLDRDPSIEELIEQGEFAVCEVTGEAWPISKLNYDKECKKYYLPEKVREYVKQRKM